MEYAVPPDFARQGRAHSLSDNGGNRCRVRAKLVRFPCTAPRRLLRHSTQDLHQPPALYARILRILLLFPAFFYISIYYNTFFLRSQAKKKKYLRAGDTGRRRTRQAREFASQTSPPPTRVREDLHQRALGARTAAHYQPVGDDLPDVPCQPFVKIHRCGASGRRPLPSSREFAPMCVFAQTAFYRQAFSCGRRGTALAVDEELVLFLETPHPSADKRLPPSPTGEGYRTTTSRGSTNIAILPTRRGGACSSRANAL